MGHREGASVNKRIYSTSSESDEGMYILVTRLVCCGDGVQTAVGKIVTLAGSSYIV